MIELLRNRRSIRKYTEQPIEDDKIAMLQEAALRSYSSRTRDPWRFVFVTDPDMKNNLARSKEQGSSFISHAPLIVAVCADETVSDVWIEDCAVATTIIQITAESLGLGSCWVQIRERMHTSEISSENYIRSLFHFPKNIRILTLIPIGYPSEKREPHLYNNLKHDRIIEI